MASLPPLAAVSDLALWPGVTVSEADVPRAEAVLAHASALVRSFAGKTWTEEAVPDEVESVTVQVAARVWLNPKNLSSVTIDDFTERLETNADGLLHLTASDKSTLGGFRTGRRALWTQPTTRSEHPDRTVWVPVSDTPDVLFPFLNAEDDL